MAAKSKQRAPKGDYTLPERIKYMRERRGMTQAQLGKASHLDQSTIAQIENGRKDPSISTLKKLAEALDCHLSVLFASDDVHVFDMKRLKKRYDKVEKLNDTLYAALGKVVQYARDIGFLK